MTLTDDDLDRLLVDAGHQLDALSLRRKRATGAEGRRWRSGAWPTAAAATVAAAAAAGLFVVTRDDDPAPAAPIATVAAAPVVPAPPPELPVIGSDTLPFEVLAATPPGFQVTQYFSAELTGFMNVFDGHALLLGWGDGDVLVPVIVRPRDDVEPPGQDARTVTSTAVTGWIDGDGQAAEAQLDLGSGNVVVIDALGSVPDDVLIGLAEALDPASSELVWAAALPQGLTQIGRQRPEVWQRAVFYVDFDAGESISYSAYSSFPVYQYFDLGVGSTVTAVDGFPGAWTIEDSAGMASAATYWAGDDDIVRSYAAWQHDGDDGDPPTAADLEAVIAQVRPATAAERAQYVAGAG